MQCQVKVIHIILLLSGVEEELMFVEDREPDSILCHHGTGEDHVTSTCDVPVSETNVGSRCLNYVYIALLKMCPPKITIMG